MLCIGKLNLVDLAGSERVGKTDAAGDRLKEVCICVVSIITCMYIEHVNYG